MKSYIIFQINKTLIPKVEWMKLSPEDEIEWQCIRVEKGLEIKVFKEIVKNHLTTDFFIFSLSRKGSTKISFSQLIDRILLEYETQNFTVWDENFQNVIEFNNVGIYRVGAYDPIKYYNSLNIVNN